MIEGTCPNCWRDTFRTGLVYGNGVLIGYYQLCEVCGPPE